MLDTVLMHRRSDANIGDAACTPAHYFDFGAHEIIGFGQDASACRRAILGGGQVYSDVVQAAIYHTAKARHRVVWGVGISARNVADISFDILEGSSALIGSRNWGVKRCEFIPCASAMSPLFDAPEPPLHDVVCFWHARKSERIEWITGIPQMTNHNGTLPEAIRFLASGATVVTNSYHGTYWAMCLGRRVLCLPFSDKFSQFQDNPVFATPEDWVQKIHTAEARPDVLEDARRRNLAFYDKVMNLT